MSETNIKFTRTILRGSSPSTVRLESRVRELEDLLDLERDGRVRAERNANELSIQLEALSERLDELSGSSSLVVSAMSSYFLTPCLSDYHALFLIVLL
ncbi:unnamed protein product [Dibothriocephalus latus]|uniref:Uncharacterized protein n=1 Tax=Dibothriocephalus latus TaxID=60516 RepID=A0A3P7MTS4_DIBLA|nr:unnamed protein product [Dibothriocephalus latus]